MIGRINGNMLQKSHWKYSKGISSLFSPVVVSRPSFASLLPTPTSLSDIASLNRQNQRKKNDTNLRNVNKMNGQPFSRRFFQNHRKISMPKRDEDYYGVPHAYKRHRENRDRDKWIGKGRVKGKGKKGARHGLKTVNSRKDSTKSFSGNNFSRKSTGTSNTTNSNCKFGKRSSNPYTVADCNTNNREDVARTHKQIEKLTQINEEIQELMKSYHEALGTNILTNMNENDSTNTSSLNDNSGTTASKLIATEDVFRQICIKQRQLVAGWSYVRPLSNPLWKWSDDIEKNTLPPVLAFNAIRELESLRRRRSDLIMSSLVTGSDVTNAGAGMLEWFSTNIFNLSGTLTDKQKTGQKKNLSPQTLDELAVHISSDFTASVRLYAGILSCFNWWQDRIPKQMSQRQIEQVVSDMNDNFTNGNPNVKPDAEIYSHLIMCHQHTKQLRDAEKSAEVLKIMLDRTQLDIENGIDTVCRPTPRTFNLVLTAFYNVIVHTQGNDNDVVVMAVAEAEKVLILMEQEGFHLSGETLDADETDALNDLYANGKGMKPYHTMLKIYRAVNPDLLTDYPEKVESLMIGMIGEDASNELLSSNGEIIDTSRINHLILQDFVHSFASARDRESLNKAKILLEKMENTRSVALREDPKIKLWDLKFPHANIYNSVIMGHVLSGDDALAQGPKSKRPLFKDRKLLYQDAMYGMRLLDSMLQYESSLPQLHTYSRLVRLFANSMSRSAGRWAEEILSRMEMHDAFSIESRSTKDIELGIRIKQAALECWAVSAAAGLPKAAVSASSLFHRLDERLNFELGSPERRQMKVFFYNAVIEVCSETVVQNDKAEALDIAFAMYNRISDEDITPTSSTYVFLLKCCQLLPPSSQDRVMSLSKAVFTAACSDGRVSRHVLFMLRQVNYSLYEAYKKKPEHSEAIKQMKIQKNA